MVGGFKSGLSRISKTVCEFLILGSDSIVSHRFQNPAYRLLIIIRDAAVLLYKVILHIRQRVLGQSSTNPCQDVGHVETELCSHPTEVGRSRITRSRFVICLSSLRNTQRLSEIVLCHRATLAFFLESRANRFGKMQNNSFLVFTNASKCIIVHLIPHETARNCTMPNTCISEQARKQARDALDKRGQSAKDFAVLNNLNPSTVYAVLSGQSRCRRGEAHRAAVLLGIKDGVITH